MDNSTIIKQLNSRVEVIDSTFSNNNLKVIGFGFSDIEDDGEMSFLIEIASIEGNIIPNCVSVVVNLYDADNTIIFSEDYWVNEEKFGGYDTLNFYLNSEGLAFNTYKSRVFCKKD